MEIPGIARALHVLAVVLWIGGVAMVTTVPLPAARRQAKTGEQVESFEHNSLSKRVTDIGSAAVFVALVLMAGGMGADRGPAPDPCAVTSAGSCVPAP